MKKSMKRLAWAFATVLMALGPTALLLAPLAANAQSSPGFVNGQPQPTAAQWNSYFAGKVDYSLGPTNAIPFQAASGKWTLSPVTGDVTAVANNFTVRTIGGIAPGNLYPLNAGSGLAIVGGNLTVTGVGNFLVGPGSWTTGRVLAAGSYPNVAVTGITLPAGTTDFSATGGASQVVKQTSLGGALTVARLACADLSDSSALCSAASPLALANGGTAAALVASNGGILYSGASALSLLAGTPTANQILLSGPSSTPAWSTATYPATTVAGQLLYSSATNTVAGNPNAAMSGGALTLGVAGSAPGSVKLSGATSGTVALAAPATAGANTLTLPAGTTDFSATGGTSQVVKQTTSGGALTVAQLACTDLSNGATGCSTATGTSGATVPLLNGANTWSGVQSFNSGDHVLKGATSGTLSVNAAAIAGANTLTLPAGTTDFSATGGTSQVVKQTSAGGAFTVARLACADLSDSSALCSAASPLAVANGGTGIASGTSGGVPYFSGSASVASSGALSANNPVIGGGTGAAPSSGARSGNTTTFGTTSGALTSGHCVQIDASGNLTDAGIPCTAATPAITLISTLTANNTSGALTWTGLSSNTNYLLVFNNLVPATSNDKFVLQFGTGAGPTWITSGYTSIPLANAGGTVFSTQNAAASGIEIDFSKGVGTGAGFTGLSGQANIGNLLTTGGQPTQVGGFAESNVILGNPTGGTFFGFIPGDATAKTAIRIFNNTSGHNISSGSASLFAFAL